MLSVSLEELGDPSARPDLVRNVDWFRSCVGMADAFDWDLFEGGRLNGDPIRLRYPNPIERQECPRATWYIVEGVHRTLVAGALLDQRRIVWRPFRAIASETNA